MTQRLKGAEIGFRIYPEGGGAPHDILSGAGAPGGDAGILDAANPGSVYIRTDAPYGLYKKTGTANTVADWEEVGNVSLDELNWRNERVFAATNDTVSAGTVDPTSWSDNEQGLDGNDFAVNDYILGDMDGTPALFRVSAVTGPTDITVEAASQPLAANDTYVIQNYLPDSPAAQEAQAIIHFPTTTTPIKIADFNWSLLTGVNLSGGYVGNGTNANPAPGDTGEAAIAKLDANQRDLVTLSGEALGAVDHGTMPGDTIQDNATTRQALIDLEAAIDALNTNTKVENVTTEQDVASLLVDGFHGAIYNIVAWEEATPANKKMVEVKILNNGTASADASGTPDFAVESVLETSNFSNNWLKFEASYSGSGASQQMNLRASSNTAGLTLEITRRVIPVQ